MWGSRADRIPKMFPSQSVRLPDNAVAVHATVAGWANRTLPRETWLAVVGRLQERGLFPVLVGTERDALPGVRCTAFHSSDLQAQAAVIKACRAFVGSDSGLLHVAAAVGTPAVGVFTCADPDLRLTRPGDLAVTSGIDCEFCLHRRAPPATTEACERGDSLCVRLVDPAAIVRRVLERIG